MGLFKKKLSLKELNDILLSCVDDCHERISVLCKDAAPGLKDETDFNSLTSKYKNILSESLRIIALETCNRLLGEDYLKDYYPSIDVIKDLLEKKSFDNFIFQTQIYYTMGFVAPEYKTTTAKYVLKQEISKLVDHFLSEFGVPLICGMYIGESISIACGGAGCLLSVREDYHVIFQDNIQSMGDNMAKSAAFAFGGLATGMVVSAAIDKGKKELPPNCKECIFEVKEDDGEHLTVIIHLGNKKRKAYISRKYMYEVYQLEKAQAINNENMKQSEVDECLSETQKERPVVESISEAELVAEPIKWDNKDIPFEQIKQLKELLDMGAITQEEYDTKKKQLLGL